MLLANGANKHKKENSLFTGPKSKVAKYHSPATWAQELAKDPSSQKAGEAMLKLLNPKARPKAKPKPKAMPRRKGKGKGKGGGGGGPDEASTARNSGSDADISDGGGGGGGGESDGGGAGGGGSVSACAQVSKGQGKTLAEESDTGGGTHARGGLATIRHASGQQCISGSKTLAVLTYTGKDPNFPKRTCIVCEKPATGITLGNDASP